MKRAAILLVPLLLLFAAPSRADTENHLFTVYYPGCEVVAASTIESRTIIFRLHQTPAASVCIPNQDAAVGLIKLAFATIAFKQMDTAAYRSVFLGRLIRYAWLSGYLAEHAAGDANWSAITGKTKSGERAEAYVQRVLAVRPILDPIDEVLKPYGYRAGAFSCEKAMVSGPDTGPYQPAWVAPDKRLPFDALCHLVLKPLE